MRSVFICNVFISRQLCLLYCFPLASKLPQLVNYSLQSPFQPGLIKACFHGDPDEVRSLLHKKEDVNYQDVQKRTPLHAAAFCGEAEICKLLILNGARVNSKDSKWLTPLHRACAVKSDVGFPVIH